MNIYLKYSTLGMFLVASSLVLTGCIQWPFGSATKKDGLILINVLDKEYFDDCHIKGSINVPFTDVVTYAKEHIAPNAHIVVYCGNYECSASSAAAKLLTEAGFTKVRAFEGGSAEAIKAGLPIEGACKQDYLKQAEKPAGLDATEDIAVITAEELKVALEAKSSTAPSCCGKK